MVRIVVERVMNASVETVFQAVSDIEELPNTVPAIVKTEFLSEIRSGVGAQFRETRLVNGKEAITVLRVTEYVENKHVRMVADTNGTIWDTTFTVVPTRDGCRLTLAMDAKAYKLMPKIMNFLFQKLFKVGLSEHVDALERYFATMASSENES